MSLKQLVQSAQGQAPTKSATPTKSTGLSKLISSAIPVQASIPKVITPPKSLGQKVGDGILKGATAITDFLLPGVTDTLSSDIAHVTATPRTKALLPTASGAQNIGAALQIGSLAIPATSAEKIAGSVVEGTLAKVALKGAASGAQFGVLGGAGQALSKPNASDKDIATEALKQGVIGAGGGAILGLGGASLSKLLSKAKPIEEIAERKLPVTSTDEETPIKVTKISPPFGGFIEAPKQPGLLENPTPQKLLPSPNPKTAYSVQGEGFSMAEKADPEKVVTMKATNDYRTALAKFNENPSPTKLSAVMKARSTMESTRTPAIEPVKPSVAPKTTPTKVGEVSSVPIKSSIKVNKQVLKDIKTPDISTAKASTDINRKLVSQGFDELPEEQLSQFNSITKADQEERVGNLLTNDLEKSQRMALGEEKIPSDVHPQVLFNAVKNKATKEGDGELLRALASSPIAKQRSLAAQALGASGFNNGEVDAVKAITDINKTREKQFARTNKSVKSVMSDTVKQAKSEIKRTAPSKQTVADFIQSLTC